MTPTHAANRILANHANAVRTASILASAQRASDDIRLLSRARQGYGAMAVSGPYSGAADTHIEVQVLASGGSGLRASTPIIQGVGNGTLAVSAIDGAAVAETLTFTLANQGDPARAAELAFYGVTLRALVPGVAGNALRLSVTRNLILTDRDATTLATITAGTKDLIGAQWDFGAVATTGASIPHAAPRIAFAGYPQVHRHWKTWDGAQWIYHLDPAPSWDIAADTRVQDVAGDYSLALTDGITDETYPAITLYDFLSALPARSTLIEVVGTLADDRAPGGQGVTDIPLRTDAHALPVTATIASQYGAQGLSAVTVAPSAPTENIQIDYVGLGAGAREAWSVTGSVSGALGTAYSGESFGSAVCGFTIPKAAAPAHAQGRIRATFTPTARSGGEGLPAVCFKPLQLGALGRAQSVTFVYTQRPPAACNCDPLPALALSERCLGLTDPDGGPMTLDAAYQTRLVSLYDWRSSFIASQVDISTPKNPKLAPQDMDLCDAAVTALADTLAQVYTDATALAAWDAALTATQADLVGLASVGLQASTDIVSGMPVGTIGRHPVNDHVYRVDEVIYFTDDPDIRPAGNRVQATLDEIPSFLDAGWPTSGGSAQLTVVTGQSVSGAAPSYTYYDYGYKVTVSDFGTADDLRSTVSVTDLARRYQARMDYVLTIAGIVPKPDASRRGGDGCWRDDPQATHWWVDQGGRYLPAFTNQAYVAAEQRDGAPVATHEFGFGLVVDCADRLKEGDRIHVTLEGVLSGYGAGDRFVLPLLGAQPAAFADGVDGDATQTWAVSGSVGGAYPDWSWSPESPSDYTAGPLDCTLEAGGIPFEEGDRIRVTLEVGELQWRRDAGAWTTADLYGAPIALGDGLALTPTPGVAPSFVADDRWVFTAVATYGTEQLRAPREGHAFAWAGDALTLAIDLGAVVPIEAILIAQHCLPSGAGITIAGGDLAAADWTLAPAWRAGPILALAPEGATARYLEIAITGTGTGAEIGWLWAGTPWAPVAGASSLQHRRQYGLTRSSARNPTALYRGRGTGGSWAWALDAGAALFEQDLASLLALLDHVAENGLEWVCLVPDLDDPSTATLAQIDADEVVITEHLGERYASSKLYGVELPFRGVLL